METNETWILGIRVSDRVHAITEVQNLLTKFGCSIRTRVGLHDVVNDSCSPGGVILLQLVGETAERQKLESELQQINGVTVKRMVI
ncbi:MAG TPA: hypothetical protein PK664_02495 [Paludibacteraceae bacterium]|nr:hypothetical protein [Paludibacteraceae bacterium]